jgi:hypothetical protein
MRSTRRGGGWQRESPWAGSCRCLFEEGIAEGIALAGQGARQALSLTF